MRAHPYANTPENWANALVVFVCAIPVVLVLALVPALLAWCGLLMLLGVPAMLFAKALRR